MISQFKKLIEILSIQILGKMFLLMISFYLARTLAPSDFGDFNFISSIIIVLSVPVATGLPNLAIREVAAAISEGKSLVIEEYIKWSGKCILLSSIVVICMFFIFNYKWSFFSVYIALLIIPLRGFVMNIAGVLNGMGSIKTSQILTQFTVPAIYFIILYFIPPPFSGLFSIFMANIASLLFVTIIGLVFLKSGLKRFSNKDEKCGGVDFDIRAKWKVSYKNFVLIGLSTTLIAELPAIFLGINYSSESVAYYKIAMQIVGIITLIFSSINVFLSPKVASNIKVGNVDKAQSVLSPMVNLSFLLMVPIMLTLIFKGEYIITLVFGTNYENSYDYLLILLFGQLINIVLGPVGMILNMSGGESDTLKLQVISLFSLFLFYFIFSYYFHDLSIVIASTLSFSLWKIAMSVKVYRSTGLKSWVRLC